MSAFIGIAGIVYSIYFVFSNPSLGFSGYLDKPSMVLLGLAPPSVMLLSHTIGDYLVGFKLLLESLFKSRRRVQQEVIRALTHCSAKVRSDGIGALMAERKNLRYPFLLDGVSMIINDFSVDEIRHNLQAKINAKQSKLDHASHLFENLAKVCPGVGMIGTLLGLIAMMAKLQDPSAIGSGMALALITTLYGLLLGTFIYGPFAEKISVEAEKMLEIDLMVLEGVLLLKSKKSSLHLKDVMQTYGKNQAVQKPRRGA